MDRLKTEAMFWKREIGDDGVQAGSSPRTPISPTVTAGAERMAGIDPSLPFHPLRIAVLTVSDTRNDETDRLRRACWSSD